MGQRQGYNRNLAVFFISKHLTVDTKFGRFLASHNSGGERWKNSVVPGGTY